MAPRPAAGEAVDAREDAEAGERPRLAEQREEAQRLDLAQRHLSWGVGRGARLTIDQLRRSAL
jgi:hypothetical protein